MIEKLYHALLYINCYKAFCLRLQNIDLTKRCEWSLCLVLYNWAEMVQAVSLVCAVSKPPIASEQCSKRETSAGVAVLGKYVPSKYEG